jgi:3-oxoadipate enol-lactonase
MKEGTVKLKDGKVFYRSDGKGEPLILLHALGLSSEMYLQAIPLFAEHFTVYALDLPGFGDSDKPARFYDFSDQAASVLEFIDALGIDKFYIVGSSIGAAVALDIAVKVPDRVKKLVLAAYPYFRDRWDRLEMIYFNAHRYDPQGMPRVLAMQDLKHLIANPTNEALQFINRLRAKAGLWCKVSQSALALWDTAPYLPKVNVPTLVLYGSGDLLGTTSGGFRTLTENIKGAEKCFLEGLGHFPFLDDPVRVSKPILKFLKPEVCTA